MDPYVALVLDPFEAPLCHAPICSLKPSVVARRNYVNRIKSSAINGHVFAAVYPESANTLGNIMSIYVDGVSPLNIFNLPSVGNLTTTNIQNTSIAQAIYTRYIAFGIKVRPLINDISNKGVYRTGFHRYTYTVAGTSPYRFLSYSPWMVECKGFEGVQCISIPIDASQFKYRILNDAGDADKGSFPTSIYIIGFGFPLDTEVFEVEIVSIVEYMTSATLLDYFPLELGVYPGKKFSDIMNVLKEILRRDSSLIVRKI